jgi:hypothetical protein
MNKLTVDGTIDQNAHSITVAIDEFLEVYREATPIDFIKHYPASHPSNHVSDIIIQVVKGKAMECVYKLVSEWEPPAVMLMTAPERKVIAKTKHGIGQLYITPATTNIEVLAQTSKKVCPRKSIECAFGTDNYRVLLHPMSAKTDFTNPFWHLKVVNKKDDANMELVERTYRFKAPTIAKQNTNKDELLTIYVATTFKSITVDEELVLFRDQPEEDAKPKRSTAAFIEAKPTAVNKKAKIQS